MYSQMEKVENRLIMLWLFQYEKLRIWNALQTNKIMWLFLQHVVDLWSFLPGPPVNAWSFVHTEDSTRTWIEIYSRLLNREITSALEISWATNAQSLGAAKYLWCLPWSHPALGFCFHPLSEWGVGGILLVTSCHCSVQLWPVGEQLH